MYFHDKMVRCNIATIIALFLLLICRAVGHNFTESFPDCPRGHYRTSSKYQRCSPCPRGRYGITSGLTTSLCSAPCPAGKYGDEPGAESEDDCKLCPPGTYGVITGLTSKKCSAVCAVGKYSPNWGQTSAVTCTVCPPTYKGEQCGNPSWPGASITPRGRREF